MRFFVKRVWLFVPLFTGIVVLPATLNLITHGQIVVPLGTWFGHPVGLTRQGLDAAGLIVTRVAVSISLVVLLTLTTPWNRLLAALRALFVPRMFILVLGLAYRYVFHLLNGVTDMYTARKARTRRRAIRTWRRGGRSSPRRPAHSSGRRTRSPKRCTMAMVARGYTGPIARCEHERRARDRRPVGRRRASPRVIATLGVDRVLAR